MHGSVYMTQVKKRSSDGSMEISEVDTKNGAQINLTTITIKKIALNFQQKVIV